MPIRYSSIQHYDGKTFMFCLFIRDHNHIQRHLCQKELMSTGHYVKKICVCSIRCIRLSLKCIVRICLQSSQKEMHTRSIDIYVAETSRQSAC